MNLETFTPIPLPTLRAPHMSESPSPPGSGEKRRPGRPPTYVFSKPDSELSENERRLKGSVIKRRLRQNRSYHKKKRLKELAEQAAREHHPPHLHPAQPAADPATRTTPHFPPHDLALALGHHHVPPNFSLSPSHLPNTSYDLPRSSPQQLPFGAHSASSKLSSIPSTVPQPIRSQDQAVPISTPAPVYRTQASSLTHCTNADPLSFLGASANRTVSAASAPLQQPMLPAGDDRVLSSMLRGTSAGFDAGMMGMRAPNAAVLGQGPAAGAQFSVDGANAGIRERREEGRGDDDKDEAQLLADMLALRHERHAEAGQASGGGGGSIKGIREFTSEDLGMKTSGIPKTAVQQGLKHLVLFPGSFTSEAALFVMGIESKHREGGSMCGLEPLVEMQLLRKVDNGRRYELNEIAKGLISSESYDDAGSARQRFVSYFMEKLREMDRSSVGATAETRLQMMKTYDEERENVTVALQLCRDMGGKAVVVEFLSVAATVMRYSTPAAERVEVFGSAVGELDGGGSGHSGRGEVRGEARVRLALGEAHLDLEEFALGEEHLRRAIASMTGGGGGGALPVATSVLALVLLGEARIRDGDYVEAKKLLVQALKSLKEGGVGKSSLGVCCLLHLGSAYALCREDDEAVTTVNAALDVLGELGYARMPIYADALGTLGCAHARRAAWADAQTLFCSALKVIQAWMARPGWRRAPVQHCAPLDVALVEAIAHTYRMQRRHDGAAKLAARAAAQRARRGLPAADAAPARDACLLTRHLY